MKNTYLIFKQFRQPAIITLCLVMLISCSNMSRTQQRTLSGAGIGSGVGAVGTIMTGGCVSCGAAVGAAVGAGSGYIYDQMNQ